jgi:hypothetical protein
MGAQLFNAYGHIDMMTLIVAFRTFAKAQTEKTRILINIVIPVGKNVTQKEKNGCQST